MTGGMSSLLLRLGFHYYGPSMYMKKYVNGMSLLLLTAPKYNGDHYTVYDSQGWSIFCKSIPRP